MEPGRARSPNPGTAYRSMEEEDGDAEKAHADELTIWKARLVSAEINLKKAQEAAAEEDNASSTSSSSSSTSD